MPTTSCRFFSLVPSAKYTGVPELLALFCAVTSDCAAISTHDKQSRAAAPKEIFMNCLQKTERRIGEKLRLVSLRIGGDGSGPGGHERGEARVLAQLRELRILIHLIDALVSLFHGFAQINEAAIKVAAARVHAGQRVVVAGAIFSRNHL